KRAFRKLDHMVWHALWRWAKRRHPNKSAHWVSQRYCRTVGPRQGVFAQAKAQILWYQDIPITRYPKVRGKSSPMNPALAGTLDTTGIMAPEDPDHQTTEKEPPASSKLSVWPL